MFIIPLTLRSVVLLYVMLAVTRTVRNWLTLSIPATIQHVDNKTIVYESASACSHYISYTGLYTTETS